MTDLSFIQGRRAKTLREHADQAGVSLEAMAQAMLCSYLDLAEDAKAALPASPLAKVSLASRQAKGGRS